MKVKLPNIGNLWGPGGNCFGVCVFMYHHVRKSTTNNVANIIVSIMFAEGKNTGRKYKIGKEILHSFTT
jgi:hypothetical protein